ncbi:MAG: RNA polymerase sigma factor [Chloroflexi bacterium]|nr:RNA polymerase sigma factor [Chloroflexota bacterium]
MQDSVSLPHLREADRLQALELDELAARAALGDRAAFERIYNLLVDDLYSYIRGQTRNETVAEDLVANVFLKAWRSAKGYRPSSHTFRRWIFTIARNEVRDYWRASQRTLPMVEFEISDERQPEPESDPAEVRRLVQQALATLTEEQRQVVVLRYFSNKSHEDIATILGKREGAVRAQLMRALRQMRKVMGDATP